MLYVDIKNGEIPANILTPRFTLRFTYGPGSNLPIKNRSTGAYCLPNFPPLTFLRILSKWPQKNFVICCIH